MVEIKDLNSDQLIKAVQIWTGWGTSVAPNRSDSRLEDTLGKDLAADLLPLIKFLEDEFYMSDAQYVASDLREMEQLASTHFKEKYPTVADEIVKAFAWCYSFDFK